MVENKFPSYKKELKSDNIFSNWPLDKLEKVDKCPICKSYGRKIIYANVRDKLYNSPGVWNYYKCSACNCFYLDPRPTEDSINLAYENYYTHNEIVYPKNLNSLNDKLRHSIRNDYLNWKYDYSKKPSLKFGRLLMHLLPTFFRHEWDFYARHLPKNPINRRQLLDIGCGQGNFLEQIAETGWIGKGIDIDPISISLAKKKKLNVEQINIERNQLPHQSYDVVTLCHVIEHIHEPTQFINDCFNTLKPKGMLWIVTPNVNSILHVLFKTNWYPLQSPQHLLLFSKISIKKLLLDAGFTNISFFRRGYHVKDRWLKSECIKNNKNLYQISTLIKRNEHLNAARENHFNIKILFFEIMTFILSHFQDDLIVTAKTK